MVGTEPSRVLSADAQVEARGRAYALISGLLLGPVTAETWQRAADVPVIAQARGELSLDELGAAHYKLFGLEVFPFASVFLEPDALASGARAGAAHELYSGWGYRGATDTAADHLGVQLGFLPHLARGELAAMRREDQGQVERTRACAAEFLDGHVLSYLLPLVAATRAARVPVFSDLVDLAAELLADHRRAIDAPMAAPELPEWESPVADDSAGLRDVAGFFLAPARSGVWLARGDVTRLGRELEVPRGFGSRVQTLTNLLRNAGEYEQAAIVLQRLDELLGERRDAYDRIGEAAALSVYAAPWIERLGATRAVVRDMVAGLASHKQDHT